VTNEEAHRLAREKGVSRPLYALVRGVVTPFMRVWFRMHVSGAENVPASGAAIIRRGCYVHRAYRGQRHTRGPAEDTP
jgi:hypothetical protein